MATLQMGDSSKEVSEEDRDAAQVAKGKAMEAVGESEYGRVGGHGGLWVAIEDSFGHRSRTVRIPTPVVTPCMHEYARVCVSLFF